MVVDSYLELFTGIFAWQQYNALWSLLVETGIALIPFVVILIKNVVEARARQDTQNAAPISLRNLEVSLVLALSVIVLAGQPILPLTATTMTYEPPCEEFGATAATGNVTAGSTGTTYDEVYSQVLTDTTVPIWWYGVLSLSAGITHAAVAGIECAPDVSGLQVALDKNRVDDSTLMAEMQRFTEECFVPARSRFTQEGIATTDESLAARIESIFEQYGAEDIDWPGSHLFQEVPGYYDHFRAQSPVRGFSYDSSRDYEPMYDVSSSSMPAGRPTCKEWWTDSGSGLRQRIMDASDEGFVEDIWDSISAAWNDLSEEQAEDKVVRRAWDNSQAAAPADSSFVHSYNREGWGGQGAFGLNWSQIGAGMGVTGFMAIFKPTMYAIRASAPIIQALTLLAIITLLPFAVVFSNYSWTMVGVGSLAIFTVKFWSYLWFIAKWTEDQLGRAMYPDAASLLAVYGANLTDGDFALKATLIEIVTGMMFVVLPLIFSMILAWAGFRGIAAVAAVGQSFRQKTEEGGGMGGRMAVQQGTQRLGRGGKG
jgi:hypothetical protein